MRILNLSILLILFLSGCNTPSKIRNIVSFTETLEAESPDTKINIPARRLVGSNADISKMNISIKDIAQKPAFDKASLPGDISAEPLVADDTIYVLSANASVHAFDLTTHKKLWTSHLIDKKSNDRFYGGGIAYDNGRLYITNGSQDLVVLNAKSGRRITSRSFNDILIKEPVLQGDLVYILTLNNQLYALDRENFSLVWDHAGAPEKLTYGANHASLSLDYKGRLFVSYSSGQLYLLETKEGGPVWQHDLSLEQNMPGLSPVNAVGKPILDKNFAYLADSSGKLYKFDLEADKKLWERNIADIQTLNKVGNALLITTNGRQAAALDSSNGKIIWVTDIVNDIVDIEKQIKENKSVAKYNKKQVEKAAKKAVEKAAKPQTRIATFFSNIMANKKASKPKVKEPKLYYDRDKVKPINFVTTIVGNDLYQLYTSKGSVYYLSVRDGKLIDQRQLKTKLDYVTFAQGVILSGKNKVSFSK